MSVRGRRDVTLDANLSGGLGQRRRCFLAGQGDYRAALIVCDGAPQLEVEAIELLAQFLAAGRIGIVAATCGSDDHLGSPRTGSTPWSGIDRRGNHNAIGRVQPNVTTDDT
ncbi:hypothetical protein IU449_23250 [Nocardia higoensis]|uniref:Uncharacterized protein n=1 Tax=Nocardia higoensis TaxID=228599 RepID=A0ABS0DG29_9NOCA|nr:hypothetical protein [Nocardia higoensis]MBF6357429.1 hypothetical protein [Nocardia higoensis]